jgi:mannose-1-phosphate guanylyltransferase
MVAKRLAFHPKVRSDFVYDLALAGTRRKTADQARDLEDTNRWAVILAGGDGVRLLPLTRTLTGEDTPKQFCALTGEETLLTQTQRRISSVISRQRTLVIVTRAHERFYAGKLASIPDANLLVQPCNRGTAPAILYSLSCLRALEPRGVVGFFPSDHHFNSDKQFAAFVDQAYRYAEIYGERVFLLGIIPDSPEVDYGWIEPGKALLSRGGCDAFEVRRFWEKPSRIKARDLIDAGGLWNTFIMVGRVSAFFEMIRSTLPNLLTAFGGTWDAAKPEDGNIHLAELYAKIPACNFSQDVLAECPECLAVLPAQGLQWTDLGDAERVRQTIQSHAGRKPALFPVANDVL